MSVAYLRCPTGCVEQRATDRVADRVIELLDVLVHCDHADAVLPELGEHIGHRERRKFWNSSR